MLLVLVLLLALRLVLLPALLLVLPALLLLLPSEAMLLVLVLLLALRLVLLPDLLQGLRAPVAPGAEAAASYPSNDWVPPSQNASGSAVSRRGAPPG
jgi:hypothetical protein